MCGGISNPHQAPLSPFSTSANCSQYINYMSMSNIMQCSYRKTPNNNNNNKQGKVPKLAGAGGYGGGVICVWIIQL